MHPDEVKKILEQITANPKEAELIKKNAKLKRDLEKAKAEIKRLKHEVQEYNNLKEEVRELALNFSDLLGIDYY